VKVIKAMRKTENKSGKLAIVDKWLILFVLLLLVTLTLFVLDYFPYPYGIMILSAATLARLSTIVMMK
jgi:branched-subunit amino acid transport protein AzlD